MTERLYTIDEVAQLVRLSTRKIKLCIKHGLIKTVMLKVPLEKGDGYREVTRITEISLRKWIGIKGPPLRSYEQQQKDNDAALRRLGLDPKECGWG
jgi:hypothetical protein